MDDTVTTLLRHLDETAPGDPVGVYLYGSATLGGLRPDSDIDVLVLTRRSLTFGERQLLVARLLTLSGWSGHADRFPEDASRRTIELTAVVVSELQPWRLWVVFETEGKIPEALQYLWADAATEWFPANPYRWAPGPELVSVQAAPDGTHGRGQLWIPIEHA